MQKLALQWLGLGCVVILWHWLSTLYPSIIIPSIIETLDRLYSILFDENGGKHIWITIQRAMIGFIASVSIGISIGVVAGLNKQVRYFMMPLEQLMMSIPPIAWIVLALIWFGGEGITSPALTIFVSQFPVVYLASTQAVRTIDSQLLEMGRSFKLSTTQALIQIGGMHILSYTYPAITLTFGTSWKIGVMAEVLGTNNGIGAQIANARVNLETADVFSWIIIAVVLYMISDKILIRPINTYTMKWR